MAELLRTHFPWTSTPLIVNAPMGGFAGGKLASAVTLAGGLGMIGAISHADLEKELSIAAEGLESFVPATTTTNGNHVADKDKEPLPIGVGLLPFIANLDLILPLLSRHKPALIWLFAATSTSQYISWTTQLRASLPPSTKIWIQVGSVTSALELAREVKPDALVLQGSDAGGHGFERGASIISLIPETMDRLAAENVNIPVLASGGIADSRAAAAALSLGACGVVMGTRFLAARETNTPPGYLDLILSAKDGSTSTTRSKLFDNVKGPNIWPEAYDGRSLTTESYEDHVRGETIEVIRERHNEAVKGEDGGYGVANRANVWAGASVGLVRKVEDAEEIVREVRGGVGMVVKGVVARL